MHGISPRCNSLTPMQLQASTEITKAVEELPTTVADLISEMALPDFSKATQAPELTLLDQLVRNETNREIAFYIELALTSPSSECDPKFKAHLFDIGSKAGDNGRTVKPYLIEIINGLKDKGLQLILDDVELNDLNLKDSWFVKLGGMSAQRATFSNMNMWNVELENVDLTGAKLINTDLGRAKLNNATITNATFSNVTCRATEASGLVGNQSAILKRLVSYPDLLNVDGEVCQADKTFLSGEITTATPDREKFTLPVHQNIVPYISPYGDYPEL